MPSTEAANPAWDAGLFSQGIWSNASYFPPTEQNITKKLKRGLSVNTLAG